MLVFLLAMMLPQALVAQQPAGGGKEDEPEVQKEGPTVSVHGIVRNVVTGEPLAHVLVSVDAQTALGVLTHADGRFELAQVPSGDLIFTIKKPGYHDPATDGDREMQRTVRVNEHTPELSFTLRPAGQLEGQLVLSTGDPAAAFDVQLLRRLPRYGRMEWMPVRRMHTDDQGNYAFYDLEPGDYTLHTQGHLENLTTGNAIEPSAARTIHRNGYPCAYYPGVANLSAAGQIKIGPGEHTRADVNLTLEPFYPVSFSVTGPDGGPFQPNLDSAFAHQNGPVAVDVADAENRRTGYTARYDVETQTIQADLPNGQYSVRTFINKDVAGKAAMGGSKAGYLMGFAPFTVAGHALHNLPLALFVPVRRELTVRMPAADAKGHESWGLDRVWMSAASDPLTGSNQELNGERDGGDEDDSFNIMFNPLSAQWLHVKSGGDFCIDRMLAAAPDPTREPIVNNPTGPNGRIEIVLRENCAQLTLALPAAASEAAIRPDYSVWIVPEFPTLEEPARIRLSSLEGADSNAHGLAPGRYRVYTLRSSVDVPYHDQEAMERMAGPGQSITVAAGEHTNLVVEMPKEEAGGQP